MIFTDTESVGFYSPTVLIQWALDYDEPQIHNLWESTVGESLELIEYIMNHEEGIVGFNLSHDNYHFNRTYNILSHLPKSHKPSILDYHDIETGDYDIHRYCVIPQTALDLMLVGRKTKFQSTLNQKDIRIRRVPKVLAYELVQELHNRIAIPDIYFSRSTKGYKWEIKQLDIDTNQELGPNDHDSIPNPNFVNIKLSFNPSTALKAIIESIRGEKVDVIEDFSSLPNPEEYVWWPHSGRWLPVAHQHIWEWTHDPRRIKYAKNDIVYTRDVYNYLDRPPMGDTDSVLACAIGAMHWSGFDIDRAKATHRLGHVNKIINAIKKEINFNAPVAVKSWLYESMDDMEKISVADTTKDTLLALLEWKDENPEVYRKVKQIFRGRRYDKERDLLEKILTAGKLFVTFKSIGTKSNRMSGGQEDYLKKGKGGALNPQGIKKGKGIRSVFTLGNVELPLCGGDFDAFEVSIADAEWADPKLREALLTGKKIHALFGAEMYSMTYEEVYGTKDNNENDPDGYYSRAKKGFFASLYLAQAEKIGKSMWISTDEADEGLRRFKTTYSGVGKAQQAIYEDHMALRQPSGIGTEVIWVEPKKYVESFLGFRRYFEMEYSVIRALFDLANKPTDKLRELGKGIRVQRRDRIQTASGATASALFGAAFNLNSSILRSATNHKIQSPGGEITKEVQVEIWSVQPRGINTWYVKPMNIHDEIECPTREEVIDVVKQKVHDKVESYRDKIPMIGMEWKTHLKNWGEK